MFARVTRHLFGHVMTSSLIAGLGVLSGGSVHADTEPVHLSYRAPGECLGAAEFQAAVLSRAPAARVVEARDGLREFVVVVETRGAAFAGRLTISDGTSSTSREFVGPTCAVVTSALALVAALAIDPRAQQPIPESRDEGAELGGARK